jgi:hypothetical protein
MPTKEQMNRVTKDIDLLIGGLEVIPSEEKHHVLPASQGRGFLFWNELIDNHHRRDALASVIDWQGFTDAQESSVIQRVLDGEDAEFLMDGIGQEPDGIPDSDHRPGQRTQERIVAEAQSQENDRLVQAGAGEAGAPSPDGWMAELSIDEGLRKELAVELDRIKRDTYVELEEQVAGWNYTQGDGGSPYHELPVTDREVLVEDYVDWGKYMERGMTWADQARVMHYAARDPFPRASAANQEPPSPGGLAGDIGEAEEVMTRQEERELFAEWKADRHAARVRDYGEADAGTYEQRVREGAMMPPLAAGPRETWPSEIAKAQKQQQREHGHGKSDGKELGNDQDGGYSM